MTTGAAGAGDTVRVARGPWPRRLRGFGLGVARRAVLDPIRDGRPRDDGWPDGLRAIVGVAIGCCVLTAALAVGSPLLRAWLPLIPIAGQQAVVPRATIWPLLLVTIVLLALFQTAALHAPWWLRLTATLTSALTVLFWGFVGLVQATGLARLSPAVPLLLVIGLVVLVALRARRSFAWWEFAAVLALVGTGVAAGPLLSGLVDTGQALGYDAVPVLVAASIQDAGLLAVPVMIAAGLSVAELTVGLTVQAGAQAARFTGRRWAYLVLAVVVAVRVAQIVRELLGWDQVADGWPTVLTTVAAAALLGLVGFVVIRLAGRPAGDTAEGLPEQANRIGLPVGLGLTVLVLLASGLILVRGVATLVLTSTAGGAQLPAGIDIGSLSLGTRVVLGVVLVVLGLQRAHRGALGEGLVLGLTGVVLVGIAARLVTGYRYALGLDPDLLNLVAALVAIGLLIGSVTRRRLTPRRSLRLATALVLSTLFSARAVLADPLGALVGISGVALVIFGVFWDLLTGSGWANRSGRRLAVPGRVLLVLAKTLLGLLVIGYAALTRSPSNVADPAAYGDLGDLVLGTALIAAAFIAIITATDDEPLPEPVEVPHPEPPRPRPEPVEGSTAPLAEPPHPRPEPPHPRREPPHPRPEPVEGPAGLSVPFDPMAGWGSR